MLLARISEPADPSVVQRVHDVGAARVVDEVHRGVSPLAGAHRLRIRLQDGRWRQDPEDTQRVGARTIIPGDPEWPSQLDDLGDRRPLLLWVIGAASLRLLSLRSIAVVGARAATGYGESAARVLASEAAEAGWTVTSGGAYGIDAAAHVGALTGGGTTICLLPGGIDVPYPRGHESLIQRIADRGLLVCESPPGCAPMRQRFLTRNRLIAALTRATVVVEAALRSGSRNTAATASALGRHVLAVPGPVTSAMSSGCHEMIRSRTAELCTGFRDVASLIEPMAPEQERRGELRPGDELDPDQSRVLDAVPLRRPAPVERLAVTAGLTPREVIAILGLLESSGLVRPVTDGWVRVAASRA